MNKNSLWFALCALSMSVSGYSASSSPIMEDLSTMLGEMEDFLRPAPKEEATPMCECPCREVFSSYFMVGGDYTRVHFKPKGTPSFTGNLGGVQGMYEYRPENFIYAAGKFDWKEGKMHASPDTRTFRFMDGQERLGWTFASGEGGFLLTFYSGLGFRYVDQKLTTPIPHSSVRFRYNEFYVPLGFETDIEMSSWFTLGFDFTWMPQIFPTVTINPLKGARWVINSTVNNYYAAMPLEFSLTCSKRFQVIVTPFYEYWRDGSSTAETSTGIFLGLPANTYNYYGVDLNFRLSF